MQNPDHLLPLKPGQPVILLVDDEPMILNLARIVLEDEGYFILTAGDGEEALFLSRTFPGTIHLLLSDVKMPKMDGLQLTEQLAGERPATKVLLMSGQVDSAVGQILLRKPFGPEVLKQRVRHTLHSGAVPPKD
jgi:two-component system, cell cycle sensor histidine kinase and response regulator CckA